MAFRVHGSLALPLLVLLSGCSSGSTPATSAAAGSTSIGGTDNSVGGGGGAGGIGGASGTNAATAGSTSSGGSSGTGAADSSAGAIPIIAGPGVDVPYQLGANAFGIQGSAFFAQSAMGTSSVVLDKTQPGKVCLKGTVEMVPTPADGSHPPYSDYWGIDLGFNLNQGPAADPNSKTPWVVAPGVVGFWFTVEGATIPPIRFKTTPTGKDPAQEQDSCALVTPTSGVPNQVLFQDMYVQCWDGPQGTATTDISAGLEDVGLQVAGGTEAAYPLDFCLTGFGVITR